MPNYPKDLHMQHLQRFLHKFSRVAKCAYDFGGYALHPVEIHTLAFITGKGRSYVSEIARETAVTRGAVSQVVARLTDKGLVDKAPDPANTSRMLIHPTVEGQRAAAAHDTFHDQRDQRFLAFLEGLDADQRRIVKQLFFEMDCWMDNYLDDT